MNRPSDAQYGIHPLYPYASALESKPVFGSESFYLNDFIVAVPDSIFLQDLPATAPDGSNDVFKILTFRRNQISGLIFDAFINTFKLARNPINFETETEETYIEKIRTAFASALSSVDKRYYYNPYWYGITIGNAIALFKMGLYPFPIQKDLSSDLDAATEGLASIDSLLKD